MRTSGTIQGLTSHPRATWTRSAPGSAGRAPPSMMPTVAISARATSSASPAICTAARSNTTTPSSRPYVSASRPTQCIRQTHIVCCRSSNNWRRPNMQVEKAPHGTVDGEERCACRFTVCWTEGPRRGCSDKVGVEVVYCVLESPIQDPVLTEFLDDVRNRFGDDQEEATAVSQQAAPSGEEEIALVSSLTSHELLE
uniref:Uncharacterized protein n=1 Tax=Aegilops tauschii subsp. strangulata TaxID=200361 RepID=A0A453STG3_AEGTS